MSEHPKKRSKKYVNEDFKIGYKLMARGKKTLDLVKHSVPTAIPCPSLVQRKFNFMALMPGIVIHIRTYINVHLKHTDAFKNNGNLAGVCCDEVYLSKLGQFLAKFDLVLGTISIYPFKGAKFITFISGSKKEFEFSRQNTMLQSVPQHCNLSCPTAFTRIKQHFFQRANNLYPVHGL